MNIYCKVCGRNSNFKDKNFPACFVDKNGQVEGYICKKCTLKLQKAQARKKSAEGANNADDD